ncbi:MAG: hypothetical protein JWO05_1900 [Gemmatimonadetes bacterium]|nr:hypothetical protein [Gemmatimonadota bacterium]
MKAMRAMFVALALALASPACALKAPTDAAVNVVEGTGPTVLFIGNSLTYVNDLPSLVRAISRLTEGEKALRVASVAFPDYSLLDHWFDGRAVKAMREGPWNFVVFQQGPSTQLDSRAELADYAFRFGLVAKEVKATPAMYSVWPFQSNFFDLPASTYSYQLAADTARGVHLPAGDAWASAFKRDASLALYSSDGLHPTLAGSVLAALVISEKLTGHAPASLPARLELDGGGHVDLSDSQRRIFLEAAAEAIAKPPFR